MAWVPNDMEQALNDLGIRVESETDDELKARCPGHFTRVGKTDHRPSWSINRNSGLHHCFSCGYKGSFSSLVADTLGVSEFDADLWTLRNSKVERRSRRKKEPAPIRESALALFVEPPDSALRERQISRQAARHYGILWDPNKSAWVLPIRLPLVTRDTSERGELIGWQHKTKHSFRNYPTGVRKSTTLFGIDVVESETIFLVESPLDAARLYSEGFKGVVASFGVNVSKEQVELLHGMGMVVLALDNDKPGRQAMDDLHRRYRWPVIDYSVAPDTKDVGEMTSKQIREAIEGVKLFYAIQR